NLLLLLFDVCKVIPSPVSSWVPRGSSNRRSERRTASTNNPLSNNLVQPPTSNLGQMVTSGDADSLRRESSIGSDLHFLKLFFLDGSSVAVPYTPSTTMLQLARSCTPFPTTTTPELALFEVSEQVDGPFKLLPPALTVAALTVRWLEEKLLWAKIVLPVHQNPSGVGVGVGVGLGAWAAGGGVGAGGRALGAGAGAGVGAEGAEGAGGVLVDLLTDVSLWAEGFLVTDMEEGEVVSLRHTMDEIKEVLRREESEEDKGG
ncbi:hypothetical protein B484DRAFT_274968, partial [Ochromonadaceae sp. CCMP2298]